MRKSQDSQILLDWATISYRTLMRTVVFVVLAVVLGGVFFYLRASLRGTPEELALLDIGRAERLLHEAEGSAAGDPGRAASVGRAGSLLTDARQAFDRKAFAEARAAAQQSQAYAEKVLEGQSVDSFAARIFKFEGDVKVKRAREFTWSSVGGNTALKVGDQVKTSSSGSAQIIYFDGTITTIKPASLVEVRELYEDPTTKVRKVEEKVNWGGVSATTSDANAAGSVHAVSTDSTTTRAYSRAQFDVGFDVAHQSARTEVHSGSAEVAAAGTTRTLKSLERLEVEGRRVVARGPIPDAPDLLNPADSRVFLASASSSPDVSLRWSRVARAARYRLQLSRTGLFSGLAVDKPDIRSTNVRIPALQEGTYYWRVSALDAAGVEGGFSEVRRFKVSGARDRAVEDRTPPDLQIKEFLPSGHLLIISGKTETGALLTVEGQAIDVYDDGTFTAVIRMKHEGKNQVEIVAQDSAGNETRLRRSVFVEAF